MVISQFVEKSSGITKGGNGYGHGPDFYCPSVRKRNFQTKIFLSLRNVFFLGKVFCPYEPFRNLSVRKFVGSMDYSAHVDEIGFFGEFGYVL